MLIPGRLLHRQASAYAWERESVCSFLFALLWTSVAHSEPWEVQRDRSARQAWPSAKGSWADAKAGTIANVVLLFAVVHGWAAQGPRGALAEYRRRAGDALALAAPRSADAVTEADLARLPAMVSAYIRQSDALGRPHVATLRARFHGRIRGGPTKPWMTFTGEQVNTYGPQPSRLFLMDAELIGLPIEVLHAFTTGTATMRVRALSLFTIVDAAGPEMDRAETVTIFNDMCILAPAALVDAPVTWQVLDDDHVRGSYTAGANTVTAELTFNDNHELIDFFSDDRTAVSTDGKTFTPQRWSTPISGYSDLAGARLGTVGECHWHAPMASSVTSSTTSTTSPTTRPTSSSRGRQDTDDIRRGRLVVCISRRIRLVPSTSGGPWRRAHGFRRPRDDAAALRGIKTRAESMGGDRAAESVDTDRR